MNYFKNISKNTKILAILPSFFLTLVSFVSIGHDKISEVKAEENKIFIAIDSTKGIGYISSVDNELIRGTNYFCEVDPILTRSATIFLQDKYQGSQDYLGDIKKVVILDNVELNNCSFLFGNLENLETIENLGNISVPVCSSFEYMFSGSPKLREVDFTGFDVSNCSSFKNMFYDCALETIDLSDFDTSNCGDFRYMFDSCRNLTSLDLSSFDTRNASSMVGMFSGCSSLEYLDISSFDLSNSPRTDEFLFGTKPKVIVAPKCVPEHAVDHIVKFDLPQETEEKPYYYDYDLNTYEEMAEANKSITYYHHSLIRTLESASFTCSNSFKEYEDLDNLDVDELISHWDFLYDTFFEFLPKKDNEPIYTILEKCKVDTINVEVGKWLTIYDKVYPHYCHALQECGGDFLNRCPDALEPDGLVHIGVNTDENIGYLSSFDTYEILKSDLRTKVDLSAKTIGNSVFSLLDSNGYEDITKVVIQDEIIISDCSNFFKGLTKLVSIDGMKKVNTELNTKCISMFEDCSKLESVDLSAFNTDKVIVTDCMFKGCVSLREITGLSFTSKTLVSMSEMFSGCQALVLLDLSSYDLTNVESTFNCIYNTTPNYIKTPKAMPTKANCDIDLYFPMGIINFGYYDLSFATYTKLPSVNSSITLISEIGKYVLEDFCDDFGKDTAYYCDANGNTAEAKLISLWEGQSKEFNKHFKGTQHECLLEFFGKDNSSCTNTSLKNFSAKYDYIYGKYQSFLDEHGGDFANRSKLISFPNSSAFIRFNHTTNESSVLIISIISVASVSTLVCLVFAKKRISAKRK